MWEGLAAVTGIELGRWVLNQVLDLGKSALEDYVKDFFKDCLDSGVARARASDLKQPMAEAIGFLIKRFVKELEFHDVPDSSIDHHYQPAIKRLVRDQAVRPILGKAFEKDCKQIDYQKLEQIWSQQYQPGGCYFPQEFDWRGVAGEYVREVKGIVRADAELRSILISDRLDEIARNTAKLSPGFDIEKYRESLQSSYGYLELYTLDSTDRADPIRLWNLFIEQTVREALPPPDDLPSDRRRQLYELRQLKGVASGAVEHDWYKYFQQASPKVLEAVMKSQHAVILGDPGSGKSTLLQYLALNWVEGKTEALPLLIELQVYVLAQSATILDFLHDGSGAKWHFDKQQLDQHLVEDPTLVMFDGLDEVFDRPTQSAIIDEIILFAQRYPLAKVLVTSRIIGYNPDRFRHAEFRQFTIQPLDQTKIHEFIDRWYDLAMGSDADKVRLKQRLKDAIEYSKAIANLADNPLLLTMMAILNRRQELPRDRADLYDQASRVLLYHWDVDHKQLQLSMDAIGRREKQEMLRLIAYEMQAGDEGLKGNLIGVDRLTRILTDYLRDQGFSEPREKANLLIQQLRERNFILCYRGADTYGFMHRTFLEYFCAVEIVNRFEKQRSISFEELRDRVFGEHWQDETWHEVLRLICGMIDAKFVGELIEFLIERRVDRNRFLEPILWSSFEEYRMCLSRKGLENLLLSTECLCEVKNRFVIEEIDKRLLEIIKKEIEIESSEVCLNVEKTSFTPNAANALLKLLALTWKENEQVLPWLKEKLNYRGTYVASAAVNAIVQGWKDEPNTLNFLRAVLEQSQANTPAVQYAAIKAIASNWKDEPNTLEFVRSLAQNTEKPNLQQMALQELARVWKDDRETLRLLVLCSKSVTCHFGVRSEAIRELAKGWKDEAWLFDFLYECATSDPFVRQHESNRNPRLRALESLLTHYLTHPKTIELLRDRAINDPDEQLREWTQEELVKLEGER
ncbi:NACHT domain-containing protein [Egbenema bharatensis]|uniref:NACHT domain-containing protein n=1 Tax=Egbenema bharatensis TaxID=3463334 RepID=UPI003A857E15